MNNQAIKQTKKQTNLLDRAIIASVAAMTIFVLAQQVQSAPAFAADAATTLQA